LWGTDMYDISEIISMVISRLLRIGQVSSVDPGKCRARVAFDDLKDGAGNPLVTADVQILQQRSVNAQNFNMPEIGEHVLCLFLANGFEEGFIIGTQYTDGNLPSHGNQGLYYTEYADGALVEYDLNQSLMKVNAAKDIEVKVAGDSTVESEKDITVKVEGDIKIEAAGDISIEAGGKITIKASEFNLNG